MRIRSALGALALAHLLVTSAAADGRNPGSVLYYPVVVSGPTAFTVVSVTNTDTVPAGLSDPGGTTNVVFNYVNTVPNPDNPNLPLDCFIVDRVETLTPADTLSVLTNCHNAAVAEGYLYVTAADPLAGLGKTAWSHNHLVGSQFAVSLLGGAFSINAEPFNALAADGLATDAPANGGDGDGALDFGSEYESAPTALIMEGVLPALNPELALLSITPPSPQGAAVLKFDIWNDNEQAFSATFTFRCWTHQRLDAISPVFDADFLANNTLNDPTEVDLTGDGIGDTESIWAILDSVTTVDPQGPIKNLPILGALFSNQGAGARGRLLHVFVKPTITEDDSDGAN